MTFCQGDPLADDLVLEWAWLGFHINAAAPWPPQRALTKESGMKGRYTRAHVNMRAPLWVQMDFYWNRG